MWNQMFQTLKGPNVSDDWCFETCILLCLAETISLALGSRPLAFTTSNFRRLLETFLLASCLINAFLLASCLINAQPLPAHSPAAYDNSLTGCTSHELTDDLLTASTYFVARLGAFFYWTIIVLKTYYRSTIPVWFIWSIFSGN